MELIFVFCLGLLVGSFLNVCAERLPEGESVLWGRSHCDFCKKTLRWYELIPLVSYILQRGRCLRCRKKLSLQYPIMELVTGAGFVALFHYTSGPLLSFIALAGLFSVLLVIFVADLKYQIIPDSMVWAGITFSVMYIYTSGQWPIFIANYLFSAIISTLAFWALWAITRGRGMGLGDVKFAFVMGLFLGYPGVIVAFYIAFLTGAIVGVILMITGKKKWKSKIAFGPFLILGMSIVWVWKDYFLTIWRMFL